MPGHCRECDERGTVCTDTGCGNADPPRPYAPDQCYHCWLRLSLARMKSQTPTTSQRTPLLGDVVHNALSAVGITPESLSGWLGKECGCKERQEKLNALDVWARRVVSGNVNRAGEFLKKILGI